MLPVVRVENETLNVPAHVLEENVKNNWWIIWYEMNYKNKLNKLFEKITGVTVIFYLSIFTFKKYLLSIVYYNILILVFIIMV